MEVLQLIGGVIGLVLMTLLSVYGLACLITCFVKNLYMIKKFRTEDKQNDKSDDKRLH